MPDKLQIRLDDESLNWFNTLAEARGVAKGELFREMRSVYVDRDFATEHPGFSSQVRAFDGLCARLREVVVGSIRSSEELAASAQESCDARESALARELEEARSSLESVEHARDELLDRLAELGEAEQRLQALRSEVSELEGLRDSLTVRLEGLADDLSARDARIAELGRELELTRERTAKAMAEADVEHGKALASMADANASRLEQTRLSLVESESARASAEASRELLARQVDELRERQASLESQNAQLNAIILEQNSRLFGLVSAG